MNELNKSQTINLVASVGKKRISKLRDFGYEGYGFDVVLREDLYHISGCQTRFFCFEEYDNRKDLIDDLKAFIDLTTD